MTSLYFHTILFISWNILCVGFVKGTDIKISNSVITLDDFIKVRIRSKRGTNGLTFAQQERATETHNTLRSNEEAADMKFMIWNPALAEMAQIWSDGCVWKHGKPDMAGTGVTYKQSIGQNLFNTRVKADLDVAEAIQAWFDEKPDYDYNSSTCAYGKKCGHYTQVVWADSWEVGCGLTRCARLTDPRRGRAWSDAQYFVCNYGPAGNFRGKKPYKKGPVCSKCSSGKAWCYNNMCRTEADCNEGVSCTCEANCLNCGIKNTGNCSCTCHPGWHGTYCSEPCVDTHASCGANRGWPAMCGHPNYGFVDKNCPALCGFCKSEEPGNVCITQQETTPPGDTQQTTVSGVNNQQSCAILVISLFIYTAI